MLPKVFDTKKSESPTDARGVAFRNSSISVKACGFGNNFSLRLSSKTSGSFNVGNARFRLVGCWSKVFTRLTAIGNFRSTPVLRYALNLVLDAKVVI